MLNKPLRSYICHGRATPGQKRALTHIWPTLELPHAPLNFDEVFGRSAERILEIGFGTGTSLLELASQNPQQDFIGIETHKPGLGALCLGIERLKLANIRLFRGDAVMILKNFIPDESLHGINIFFPDPWPKRRQQVRRLIQTDFLKVLVAKMLPSAELHLATDCDDYANHMHAVLAAEAAIMNLQRLTRSLRRPIITKFEDRALRDGRKISELQFVKL